MLIKFDISGNLRFLSHAETVTLFKRAFQRAEIAIQYSRGFNPRPRMSLPLPRTVGVESEQDLLVVRVETDISSFDCKQLKSDLSQQLPEGCQLISVSVLPKKISPQPTSVTYRLKLSAQAVDLQLKSRVANLLESQTLIFTRHNAKGKKRTVDVRRFIKTIRIEENNVIVECNISPAGSIRVNEILEMLELDAVLGIPYEGQLASPVRRVNIQWQNN